MRDVVSGLILGPLVALVACWAWFVAQMLVSGSPTSVEQATSMLVLVLFFGGAVCLLVELLLVVPLLIGFSRYGWRWLNTGTAALIVIAVAFAVNALLDWPPGRPGVSFSTGGVDMMVDGVRTFAGWIGWLQTGAFYSLLGLVALVVFRLVAVRSVSRDTPRVQPA